MADFLNLLSVFTESQFRSGDYMLTDNLELVVDEAKRKNLSIGVIVNLLKEALQYYVLSYIYSSSYGKKLLFTGGSCLRICYGLNRLSEDLYFDTLDKFKVDKKELTKDLLKYFKSNLQYKNITANVAGKGEKIYLKFPILADLGLARQKGERQKLFVKVEIDKNPSKNYDADLTPIAKYNLNFLSRSYDLPTLMANKIKAILSRTWQLGKTKITFKGRDYYDLLWLLQKQIKPNLSRLKDLTGIENNKELVSKLQNKIKSIKTAYLKEDLINLFDDAKFVEEICNNYQMLTKKYLNDLDIVS